MSRGDSGFIRPGYDGLEVPDAPTGVSASGGDESASVSFTAPSDEGGSAITEYGAVALNSGETVATGTASSSPVTVSGLTNGTSYTFKVWAINAYGPSGYSGASGAVSPAAPTALFSGGSDAAGSLWNVISSVNISSAGNATDFGDLTLITQRGSACASSTRGIFGGGASSTGNAFNVISYITIASTGNATDFGDLLSGGNSAPTAGCSNDTRGLFVGAYNSNTINYITIASAGNATDFGDMLYNPGPFGSVGACASSTRATFGGGYSGGTPLNTINYVTIASTGNATDFGGLSVSRYSLAACSNGHGGL